MMASVTKYRCTYN